MFVEWWHCVDNGSLSRTELLSRWFNLLRSEKTFGVKTYEFNNSVTADGELTDDSIELGVCVPSTNTVKVDNWVKRLQRECNIQGFSNQVVDGIPGPSTLRGCPLLKIGARGNITKLLQERLGITADGIFGNNTKQAVIGYQKSKGLSADGIVGQNTWRKLLGL